MPAYTPPAYNAVNLEVHPGGGAYTAPASNAVNLELSPAFTQTISGITAGSFVAFGTASVKGENTILPAGLDALQTIPAPVLKWDQFVRPSGAVFTQYGTLRLIQDQFLVGIGAGVLTFYGGQTVYNLTQYLTGLTVGSVVGIGADALHTDPVLYPQWTIFTQYGTPFVSTSPQYIQPNAGVLTQYGGHTVINLNRYIDEDSQGFTPLRFGNATITRDPQVITDLGHDFLLLGDAASTHVSTDPQYIKPSGYVATIYGTGVNGTTRISLWNQHVNPSGLAVGDFGTLWISLYTRYLQAAGFDSALVWDDYGPRSSVAQGGAQIYVRDALVQPTAGALTQYGTAAVSN